MERLSELTHRAADWFLYIAAGGLVIVTVIVGWQVFGRYVLNSSPSWSEQAALTLMIWYVSFAAAAGVREGFHIRIVALESAMPKPVAKIMRLISDLVVALCGIAMVIWGGELVMRTWQHVIPSLGIPRGLAYLSLPIAGALITLFSIERLMIGIKTDKAIDEEASRWS